MSKLCKRGLVAILVVIIMVFSWFWTEGFGFSTQYAYGNTIEKALNFWYERGRCDISLEKIVATEDIEKDKKLVFYESDRNTLWGALVKKKWNNKWIVVGQLTADLPFIIKEEEKAPLHWMPLDVNEFFMYAGIIYDTNIDKITVDEKSAIILNKGTDKSIWYIIDEYAPYSEEVRKLTNNIQAFDKDGKLIYDYSVLN